MLTGTIAPAGVRTPSSFSSATVRSSPPSKRTRPVSSPRSVVHRRAPRSEATAGRTASTNPAVVSPAAARRSRRGVSTSSCASSTNIPTPFVSTSFTRGLRSSASATACVSPARRSQSGPRTRSRYEGETAERPRLKPGPSPVTLTSAPETAAARSASSSLSDAGIVVNVIAGSNRTDRKPDRSVTNDSTCSTHPFSKNSWSSTRSSNSRSRASVRSMRAPGGNVTATRSVVSGSGEKIDPLDTFRSNTPQRGAQENRRQQHREPRPSEHHGQRPIESAAQAIGAGAARTHRPERPRREERRPRQRDRQRRDERNDHREHERQGRVAQVAVQIEERQRDDGRRGGGGQQREQDFPHGRKPSHRRRSGTGGALREVLQEHDGVVDGEAERQRQSRQRHEVQTQPGGPEEQERDERRQRDGRQDHHGGSAAPARREQHHQDESERRRAATAQHPQLVADRLALVVKDAQLQFRRELATKLVQPIAHAAGDAEHVRSRRALQHSLDRRLPVEARERPRLLPRFHDPRHVTDRQPQILPAASPPADRGRAGLRTHDGHRQAPIPAAPGSRRPSRPHLVERPAHVLGGDDAALGRRAGNVDPDLRSRSAVRLRAGDAVHRRQRRQHAILQDGAQRLRRPRPVQLQDEEGTRVDLLRHRAVHDRRGQVLRAARRGAPPAAPARAPPPRPSGHCAGTRGSPSRSPIRCWTRCAPRPAAPTARPPAVT